MPAPEAGNHPKTTVRELTPRLRDFIGWLEGVKVECATRGVSDKTIAAAFSGLEPLPEVVVSQTSGSQPEVKFTVERYLKNIVTQDRIEMGAQRLIKHGALLREVEREYGVPAEILVAIWGIESSFGGFTGDMDSIQALATLGWEQQYDNYFRNELIEAVRIIDQGHVEVGKLRGSWAGALGQCQFMPSNFHAYAVDKDGDGKADIWGSLPDVFASMGNFISTYCEWNPKVRAAGYRVELDRSKDPPLPKEVIGGYWGDRKEPRPARYFLWNGVKPTHKETRLPWTADSMLLMPDGEDGPAFLAMCNFRAIMRYNPSTSYAMAVATLAQEIVDEAAIIQKENKKGVREAVRDSRASIVSGVKAMGRKAPGN